MWEGYKINTFSKHNLQLPHYFCREKYLFGGFFIHILWNFLNIQMCNGPSPICSNRWGKYDEGHQLNSPSSISPAQVLQQTWSKLTLHAAPAAVAAAWGGNSVTPQTPYDTFNPQKTKCCGQYMHGSENTGIYLCKHSEDYYFLTILIRSFYVGPLKSKGWTHQW